jgi:hypothetical protein
LYNYLGLGLLGLFAFMVIPFDTQAETNESVIHGYSDMIVYDEFGKEIITQTVHNRLTDQGETFLISSVFRDGNDDDSDIDPERISSICLTNFDVSGVGETYDASTFDTDNTLGSNNCLVDTSIDKSTQGKAMIGPLIFQAPANVGLGENVTGIGICRSTSATSFTNCASFSGSDGPVLFAIVDTTDILDLQQDQTVSIRYTFDITSDNT